MQRGFGNQDNKESIHGHSFEGGKVEGNKLTFDVPLGGQGEGSMHFDMQVQGDQMTGQVKRGGEGKNEAAKISLKRVAEK